MSNYYIKVNSSSKEVILENVTDEDSQITTSFKFSMP